MIRYLSLCLLVCLLSGCRHLRSPIVVSPPAAAAGEKKADGIIEDLASRAAAEVESARKANSENPDGHPKTATEGALATAAKLLPAPNVKHLEAAMARIEFALKGDHSRAQEGWAQAQQEAAKLYADLKQAKEDLAAERVAAAAKLQQTIAKMQADADARVAKERARAEAETKRLIGYIFFGGAALCIAAAVAGLTIAAGLPFVGPKIVTGLFTLAGILGAVGVLLIRALSSPWIGRGMAAAAFVAVAIVVFGYVNHWHEKKKAD